MSQPSADANLLFGVLAMQMEFIDREQLIAGMQAWVNDKKVPLAEHLVRANALPPDDRAALEPLIAAHLRRHGGDAEKSLASMSSAAMVKHDLHHIADADLQHSIRRMPSKQLPNESELTMTLGASSSGGTRFHILRPHARGGLGEVFVAHDTELGREVALKEIQLDKDDVESRARFTREAEITGGLEHPGIVPVYGLGAYPDGRPFYAMRFIRGNSLQEAIKAFHGKDDITHSTCGKNKPASEKNLELRRLLQRFIDVCEAIEYAHSRGVLHRDLKPGNIMLGRYGETLVVDWGLAKAAGSTPDEALLAAQRLGAESKLQTRSGDSTATMAGTALGTPAYMPPEQAEGRLDLLSAASDVYSLGGTLYSILTGQSPVSGKQADEVLAKVRQGQIIPPRTHNNAVPRPLEAICLKSMSLQPSERYQTARELADEVEHWLADEPIAALPEPLMVRMRRLARKNPGPAAGLGAALLMGLVGLVLGLYFRNLEKFQKDLALQEAKANRQEALESNRAKQAEEASHRTTRQAKTRMFQDASLERHRAGEYGTSAVLLGLALTEANQLDTRLAEELRLGITLARGRLLPLRSILELSGQARACATSPDGKLAIVGTDAGQVHYVDPTSGQLTTIPLTGSATSYSTGNSKGADAVTSVAFSSASRGLFAVATDGGKIHLVKTTGTEPATQILHPGRPLSISFGEGGRRLVVAGNRLQGQDLNEVRELAIYDLDHPEQPPRAFRLGYGIYAAGLSHDGRWLVAGGGIPPNPRLSVWDLNAANDSPEAAPRDLPQPARVFSLAFRPHHAAQFATGDVNGVVRLWDLNRPRGAEVVSDDISYERQVRLTSFSEDGRLLLVGGESGVAQVWNVDTRQPLGQPLLHKDQVRAGSLTLGTAGAANVVTADFAGDVRVWALKPDVPVEQVFNHPSPVWDAAFSEDGERIITGFASSPGEPGGGRVWSLVDDRQLELPQSADVMVCCFRPGRPNEAVTCGNDGLVNFWDLTNLKRETKESPSTATRLGEPLTYEREVIYTAAFDATGNRFAYAGFGKGIHVYRFDSTSESWQAFHTLSHENAMSYIWGLRFGASSDTLFSQAGEAVREWSLQSVPPRSRDLRPPQNAEMTGRSEALLADFNEKSRCALVRWTNGQTAVFALSVDQPNTGDPTDKRPQHPALQPEFFLGNQPHGRGRGAADWSDDGKLIATGGADGIVRLWTYKGLPWPESMPVELRHPSAVKLLAFSPDGRWLATACQDGGLRLWSVQSGLWSGAGWYHRAPITRLKFSPDGRHILTASRDSTARVAALPSQTKGPAEAVLAQLEADAGIHIILSGTGTASTYTAPQPLSAAEFLRRQQASTP